MKLIFLDFDGVLNSVTSMVALEKSTMPDGLSKDAIHLVKFVCDHTDAKIVISSTWRSFGGYEWFQGLFEAYGWFLPPILDVTKYHKTKGQIRGDEIRASLATWHDIESYICIDDSSDFYDDQNLVHINPVTGFTLKDALKCIDILGNEHPDKQKELDDLKTHTKFRD